MRKRIVALALGALSAGAQAKIDLRANEQPLPVTVDNAAIARIPASYRFVEPGTLTVAISALNSPPLALLASDNRTRIGSDPDIARLLAGSLGLKLKLVPTAWEDWPLGITSGRYDVALVNIAVTEQRKEKFDFATYRVDSLAFSVKSTSAIEKISGAAPAGLADLFNRRRLRQSVHPVRARRCLLWPPVGGGLQSGADRDHQSCRAGAEKSLGRHHHQKGQWPGVCVAGGARWRHCARRVSAGAGTLGRAGRGGSTVSGESSGDHLLKNRCFAGVRGETAGDYY